jgi:hypothetical protein
MLGPVGFPEPRYERVHAACRMVCNALEHVHRPGPWMDAVELATGEETLGGADLSGTDLIAGEQNVLLPRHNACPCYRIVASPR